MTGRQAAWVLARCCTCKLSSIVLPEQHHVAEVVLGLLCSGKWYMCSGDKEDEDVWVPYHMTPGEERREKSY